MRPACQKSVVLLTTFIVLCTSATLSVDERAGSHGIIEVSGREKIADSVLIIIFSLRKCNGIRLRSVLVVRVPGQ